MRKLSVMAPLRRMSRKKTWGDCTLRPADTGKACGDDAFKKRQRGGIPTLKEATLETDKASPF